MNIHKQFREFLTFIVPGEIITRKEIMETIKTGKYGTQTTIDNYRNWFTKAGYLKWTSRGKYELIKFPEDELSSRDLRKEAYPHWRNWGEYRYLKNN